MAKKKIDERGEFRYMDDVPFEDYSDTLEYNTKNISRKTSFNPATKNEDLRTPVSKEDKEAALKAEKFLEEWGV